MIIWIIAFQGEEYVVSWEGGFPNVLDEDHLNEYYFTEKENEGG